MLRWYSMKVARPSRHEEYKEYKAQSPPMAQGMSEQIPYIHRIVEAMAVP